MRETIEIYRWMWREIDLKYEGSLGFRIVLFADAVISDGARSAQLTAARLLRQGGLHAGRAFRSPVVPAAARGAIATAACAALFGPFLMLLGNLAAPDASHGEFQLHAAGFVVFQGQRIQPGNMPEIVQHRGLSTVDVLLRESPDSPIRWSLVQEVMDVLDGSGIDKITWRDYKSARVSSSDPNPIRR